MIKITNNRILLIDDEINILKSLKRVLEAVFDLDETLKPTGSRFIIDTASQSNEAIKLVHESLKSFQPYALAFVDIHIPPGLDGIKTIQRIWEIDPDIQIVICTGSSEYSWNTMRSELKYSNNFLILKKPFETIEIQQLAFALTKKWQLNQQNRVYIDNLESILKTRSKELKETEHLLLLKTTHDLLTGLPNQALLVDRVHQALVTAKNNKSLVGCYFIDINNFQLINDSYGFQIGDVLLKSIGNRLSKLINLQVTTIARWGGNVFVVILTGKDTQDFFEKFATQLLQTINQPYEIDNKTISITASIGICIYPLYANEAYALLKNANTSLNIAKKHGHNNHQMFSNEFYKTALKRADIENRLSHAIDNNEFAFMYYPVFDLITNKILCIETSLVWDHPGRGVIPSKFYIPIAEETGIIISIEEWMLRRVCKQINFWIQKGLKPYRMSIRINDKFFMKNDFVEVVERITKELSTDSNLIELEISGHSLMNNEVDALKKMIELRNLGFHIALNDLSTWYASLNNMTHIPFEKIKINRNFMQGLEERNDHAIIVKTIITIAKNLNLEVIAEGIETCGQLNFLRQNASDKVRGYALQKPLDEESCLNVLSKHNLK